MHHPLRLAIPAEAPAIARLLAESFAAFQPLYTPGAFAATTPGAGLIELRFAEGPIWVVEQAGALVGSVSVVEKGEGLYIRSLALHPAARGQGWARRSCSRRKATRWRAACGGCT